MNLQPRVRESAEPAQEAAERDPFLPPPEELAACEKFLESLDPWMPPRPANPPMSLVGCPSTFSKGEAAQVMLLCASWLETYGTTIGQRKSVMALYDSCINWMQGYVKFVHRGKVDKLRPDQFNRLQDYEFKRGLIEAEVIRLESLAAQQRAVYGAASRGLTAVLGT